MFGITCSQFGGPLAGNRNQEALRTPHFARKKQVKRAKGTKIQKMYSITRRINSVLEKNHISVLVNKFRSHELVMNWC
jgi:hypothetical protein